MNRFICIHGHFYQPPRENPWLEEVELQDSAYPYHDWNRKVASECYAPNTASRILDPDRKIIDIVNNYSKISFDFGPTLLIWLKKNEPFIYKAIIEADRKSQERFSQHGTAIAQCYNHLIMPLASYHDKRTQIIWGLRDFAFRFGRRPEGMWLPETSVDFETLDIMAEQELKFTLLGPHQAKNIRKIGHKEWIDVSGSRIDPKMPYLCRLPSGRTISLFFYDQPISHDIAFGNFLENGENFAKRLMSGFSEHPNHQLLHIANHGETYGHHHRRGDMALAYCLYYIESNKLAKITNYGEYLEQHPPVYEVEIFENSSWSCTHGIERWRSNCGCNSGTRPEWNQNWRSTLKGAMDWLRDNLVRIYEEQLSRYVQDPWQVRDEYIEVILNRSQENGEGFFSKHALIKLSKDDKVTILKLLEMQRQAMFMYTSCGWFFDDISSMETIQVMQFAARAMQLAKDISNMALEGTYISLLERAQSNIPENKNGASLYELLVKPAVLDLVRVGVHYAVSSLFDEYSDSKTVYTFEISNQLYDRKEAGKRKLALGKAKIHSHVTWEENIISFAVLHLGDHNLVGGVREYMGETDFAEMNEEIDDNFSKNDISEVIRLIEKNFDTSNCSLWHLFKDEQRKILNLILESTLKEAKVSLRRINETYYPLMQVMKQLHVPLPKLFILTGEFIINNDLFTILENRETDFIELKKVVDEAGKWLIKLDKNFLNFLVSNKINTLMESLEREPQNYSLFESVESIFNILSPLSLKLDLWRVQNIYFSVGTKLFHEMEERAHRGENKAKKWIHGFKKLEKYLNVRIL